MLSSKLSRGNDSCFSFNNIGQHPHLEHHIDKRVGYNELMYRLSHRHSVSKVPYYCHSICERELEVPDVTGGQGALQKSGNTYAGRSKLGVRTIILRQQHSTPDIGYLCSYQPHGFVWAHVYKWLRLLLRMFGASPNHQDMAHAPRY